MQILIEMPKKSIHNEKLNILAFSDYRLQSIEFLEKRIDDLNLPIDIILYAGDDTNRFIEKDDKDKVITNHFQILANKTKYGLGAVIGNDCNKEEFKLIKGKKVYDLHRKQIEIKEYQIIGFEGAEINDENEGIGPTLYKQKYINNKIKSRLKKNKKIILVTHSPPYGLLDWSVRFGKQNIGSKAIRGIIEQNDNILLNICGHSHMNGGKSKKLNNCLVVNASNHDNMKNNIFPMGRFCLITIDDENIKLKWYYVGEEKRKILKTKSLLDY